MQMNTMIDFSKFNSLFEMTNYFNNDDACINAIIESRWGHGDVICPHCGKHHCKMTKNIGTPHYNNLKTYKEFLKAQVKKLSKLQLCQ